MSKLPVGTRAYSDSPAPQMSPETHALVPTRPKRPRPVTRPGDAPRRKHYPAPPMQQDVPHRHPDTRISPQSKTGLAICHIIYPFGGARLYVGDYALGIAQTFVSLLTCGIGGLWPVIDGIVMLAGNPRDAHGRRVLGGKKRRLALDKEAEADMLQLPPPAID